MMDVMLKAVQGAVNGTTFTPGQSRGCKSGAKGSASSVKSNRSAAACKNSVAMTRSPSHHNSTMSNFGFKAGVAGSTFSSFLEGWSETWVQV